MHHFLGFMILAACSADQMNSTKTLNEVEIFEASPIQIITILLLTFTALTSFVRVLLALHSSNDSQ
ncbi:hypothetical protein HON52_00130 [Candidatus Uhrbacteria bacterium]|nr:hypothetical protein [Candidatus Uhrbacteria bacterium]